MQVSLQHLEAMSFKVTARNKHQFIIDANTLGAKDAGPSPKELLLAAIAGCSAMDVVALLKKFKVSYSSFFASAEGELSKEHPKIFQEVLVKFIFEGENIDPLKVKEAVQLSLSKYCGVSAMVYKSSPIVYQIIINEQIEASGQAEF